MKRLMGAALVASVLACSGLAAIDPAAAASPQVKAQIEATDISARRYHRRYDRYYAYRPAYQPQYYARPTYYRPYPYVAPAPFPLGFGFGPLWW